MVAVSCSALVLTILIFWLWFRSRTALDVLDDLLGETTPKRNCLVGKPAPSKLSRLAGRVVDSDKGIPVLGGFLALVSLTLAGKFSLGSAFATFVLGSSLGFLGNKIRVRKRKEGEIREIEFFLPIVMERVVMAVQAGLDIIAALKSLMELDERNKAEGPNFHHVKGDPVSDLLAQAYSLTEAGIGFDEALSELAKKSECTSLRHAFIHLALAHKEGGELVMPLRELSDSTQLFYQEVIEEEIAKLPVKATLPLLLTFAGLLICFITVPLIQLIGITSKAAGI